MRRLIMDLFRIIIAKSSIARFTLPTFQSVRFVTPLTPKANLSAYTRDQSEMALLCKVGFERHDVGRAAAIL
jgi:hypothetical protein